MSAYPSLLSPLMDATGLIATTALNTVAQTALAAGTYASAEVDVLKISALQESGGNYLGLPATNITAQGKFVSQPVAQGFAFQSPGFNVNALGKISCIELTTQTAPGVWGAVDGGIIEGHTRVIAPEFKNANSSFITDASGNCTVNELTYTTLNPPISAGWVGTATSDLNMSDYGITNVPSIGFVNGTGEGVITMPPDESTLDFDGLNIIAVGNIACNSVTTSLLDIVVNSVQKASLSESGLGVVGSVVADGGVTGLTLTSSLTTGGGAIANYDNSFSVHSNGDITCPIITANETIISGQASSASLLVKNSGTQDVVASIDGSGLITAESYNINSGLVNIQATGAIACVSVNDVAPQFKPTYDYYVAKGGSDSGLGSILSPYLTIQRAIDVCDLVYDGFARTINVSSGNYVENLSIPISRLSIKGEGVGTHLDVGTSITGNITIDLASGNSDLNNNNITISGFLLSGSIDDSTTGDRPHRLMINNCYIYGSDRCLYMHPTYDYRCFVSNCVISNDSLVSTDPLVQCSGIGMVSFNQTQMTAKGASQMVFKLSGTCRIDVFAQNILTSDSVGTNVAVAIFNHNSSQTITLGGNAFVYGNSGAKRNAETASGVFMNNTGSLVLLSNTFVMTGLASSQMAVYATSLSFPNTIIIYGANISTSNPLALTATGISGSQGTTKVAGQSVQ